MEIQGFMDLEGKQVEIKSSSDLHSSDTREDKVEYGNERKWEKIHTTSAKMDSIEVEVDSTLESEEILRLIFLNMSRAENCHEKGHHTTLGTPLDVTWDWDKDFNTRTFEFVRFRCEIVQDAHSPN
ncbi:hypothetical protein Tco_1015404 [Tanacetum coccineum]|uniref:Uncharacterized protein n=1 Tax=Tanacetum coccineum TaxID=301880 RepID=A0ABQ5FLD6_9ASTR